MKFQILVIRLLAMILYILVYEVYEAPHKEFRLMQLEDVSNILDDAHKFANLKLGDRKYGRWIDE